MFLQPQNCYTVNYAPKDYYKLQTTKDYSHFIHRNRILESEERRVTGKEGRSGIRIMLPFLYRAIIHNTCATVYVSILLTLIGCPAWEKTSINSIKRGLDYMYIHAHARTGLQLNLSTCSKLDNKDQPGNTSYHLQD